MRKYKNIKKIKEIIISYCKKNSKEYIAMIIIFIIGIFFGIMFVNNTTIENNEKMVSIISEFVNRLKNEDNINILRNDNRFYREKYYYNASYMGSWDNYNWNANSFWNCFI